MGSCDGRHRQQSIRIRRLQRRRRWGKRRGVYGFWSDAHGGWRGRGRRTGGTFVENSFNDYLANTAGVGGSYGVVGGLGGNGSGDPGLNAPGGCGACETDPSAANGSTPSTDTASGGGGGGGGGGCCDVIGPEAFPLYGEGGLAGLVGGGGGGGAGASVVSQVLQTADISYQTAPTVGDGEVIITVTYLPGTLVPVPEPPLLSLLGFSALALAACAMLPCAKRPTAG